MLHVRWAHLLEIICFMIGAEHGFCLGQRGESVRSELQDKTEIHQISVSESNVNLANTSVRRAVITRPLNDSKSNEDIGGDAASEPDPTSTVVLQLRLQAWASHIKAYIRSIDCRPRKDSFSSRARCEQVRATPFRNMMLYMAPPVRNRVYSANLPDGDLEDATQHHSIAVVDPFPNASFGHLVFVFYIDGSTRPWCEHYNHRYLGSGFCLIHARRSQCLNSRRSALSPRARARKCEVNFIPLVFDHHHEHPDREKRQVLVCLPDIAGFGPCPKPLETVSTVQERCELRENTKNCFLKNASSVKRRPTQLCRLYQTCDHAVAIFGGWNPITMRRRNEQNMRLVYKMLRRNGFLQDRIQAFYNGNGELNFHEIYDRGLPASDKSTIRNHIRKICSSQLCADSFVIYMNGPTTTEGGLLLWDKNGNGIAENSERYAVGEILSDVTNCAANQLILLVDESYSGVLVRELKSRRRSSGGLDNVVLLASGDTAQYSWEPGTTAHWAKHPLMRSISWGIDGLGFTSSTPALVNRDLADGFTMYGAPIVRGFPKSAMNFDNLRSNFMGCQNLPAAKWMLRYLRDGDRQE